MCKLVNMQTNFHTSIQVADLKKGYIENIIENAGKCNKIDAVILFGSSLESRCKEDSDIDIVIISKLSVNGLSRFKSFHEFTKNIYAKDLKQDYDILYFKSLAEIEKKQNQTAICKELMTKGKIIYRKEVA